MLTLIDAHEIAHRMGVAYNHVRYIMWAARQPGSRRVPFPDPVRQYGNANAYDRDEVELWMAANWRK